MRQSGAMKAIAFENQFNAPIVQVKRKEYWCMMCNLIQTKCLFMLAMFTSCIVILFIAWCILSKDYRSFSTLYII